MATMMSRLFSDMTFEHKRTFVEAMLGACVPKLTEGPDVAQREELATAVLGTMASGVRRPAWSSSS